jgi:glycine/D-amino acid oxidase-like deaminating enzyme/nitrite reductase/ring-hydroxylating ferredoxin subunit
MEQINVSYWNSTTEKKEYPKLEKNLEVNTLIIGSGITGITTAYCLAKKGEKPVVIEAAGFCDGTTGNTTGKITIQHSIIYTNLVKKYGEDFAKKYAESQTYAINFIRNVVSNESIDCELEDNTAYIYGETNTEKSIIQKENEVAIKLGINSEFIDNSKFPSNNYGMIGFKNQAVFHAVRYLNGLADAAISYGAKIYCSTKAIKIEDGDIITIHCENGIIIKAKHLVIATQYPIYDGPNLFFTRLYPKRAYGIAVETKRDWPDGSYINIGTPSRSIRTHVENGKRILIVVGEGHATGREEDKMKDHYDNLIKFADEIAGVHKVLAKWSAQDYQTPDQVSYIGRISNNSNIFIATGYGKWGLSNGTLSGIILSELIVNGKSDYESIYSRERPDFSFSLGKAVTEIFVPVGELIKSKFEGTEDFHDLKQGEGQVIEYKGQKAGIYRDYNDSITILDISCRHMSTELNFNPLEKTWDCPAHGGRYAANDGRLLEGTPKRSLEILYTGTYEEFIKQYDKKK